MHNNLDKYRDVIEQYKNMKHRNKNCDKLLNKVRKELAFVKSKKIYISMWGREIEECIKNEDPLKLMNILNEIRFYRVVKTVNVFCLKIIIILSVSLLSYMCYNYINYEEPIDTIDIME